VSGKGLAGCLVTSMLFSLLRAYHAAHTSPAALLTVLDERLCGTLKRGSFVTMFYGLLDPATGRFMFASAGHNPALVYRAGTGKTEWLRSKGIPLGSIRGGAVGRSLEDSEVALAPGDVLVQFTDGINETEAPSNHEQFGFERMEQVVAGAAPSGARAVLNGLHGSVERWRQSGAPDDDETVLVVSREGVAAERRIGDAPSSAARGDATARVLRLFAQAEARGVRLRLPADLEAMSRIGAWLDSAGIRRGIHESAAGMLDLALYEVCANIAEHGCGQDPTHTIEIFWLGSTGGAGSFLIRDQGKPFRPDGWKRPNFDDPAVLKRGRGLGLEIIHRAMSGVAYFPETGLGNITVLDWDPGKAPVSEKELRHA